MFCWGNTSLNNEQREFQLVQSAFLQYIKDTNKFPTSWDDLWNNEASRPSVEWLDQGKTFGRRTDTMESFRFIAPGTKIILPQDGSHVIGMMIRPMRPPPEIRARSLIIQLKDGTRRLKQIPEDELMKIFTKIGFDLADYTGPNGNWAPETRLRPLSEISPHAERATTDTSMDYSTIPALNYSQNNQLNREKKPSPTGIEIPSPSQQGIWGGMVAFGILMAGLITWIVIRKRLRA
jgi:hypothetical protein